MTNNANIARPALVAVVAALAVAAWLSSGGNLVPSAVDAPPSAAVEETAVDGASAAAAQRKGPEGRVANAAFDEEDAVRRLQDMFGGRMDDKRVQVKALEQVVAWLMKTYPDDWRDRLYAFLQKAFPGMADQLFARFQQMETWNEWWKANRARLAELSPAERRAEMWDQRLRAFGDDAVDIFAEALRNERILDALDEIGRSPDTDVAGKLDTYVDAIHEAYGDEAADLLENRQTELMNKFLETPTVQDDLHGMSPDQRSAELRRIREGLGMDEEALGRWDELDRLRDDAWTTGERYMDERAKLVENYEGDELVRRLDELRTKTFGPEADTIRAEEESGFHRFDHRRTFGKE